MNFQDIPDGEARLQDLRNRDLEIARLALGLQMRTRITNLENENRVLKSMEKTWSMSRVSALYFSLPKLMRKVLNRL